MSATRIELGMARTPKFWLVVVDEVEDAEVQKEDYPFDKGGELLPDVEQERNMGPKAEIPR